MHGQSNPCGNVVRFTEGVRTYGVPVVNKVPRDGKLHKSECSEPAVAIAADKSIVRQCLLQQPDGL